MQNTQGNMNWLEQLLVYSSWRKISQKYWELPILQSLGLNVKDKDVLEIGCGNGNCSYLLAELGAKSVVGTDVVPAFPKQSKNPKVTFQVADATKLPFSEFRFDVVVSIAALHHIENWKLVIEEVSRVLKTGGVFAFGDFTSKGAERWSCFEKPVGKFTTGQLLLVLEDKGFTLMDITHRFFGDVVFGCAEAGW